MLSISVSIGAATTNRTPILRGVLQSNLDGAGYAGTNLNIGQTNIMGPARHMDVLTYVTNSVYGTNSVWTNLYRLEIISATNLLYNRVLGDIYNATNGLYIVLHGQILSATNLIYTILHQETIDATNGLYPVIVDATNSLYSVTLTNKIDATNGLYAVIVAATNSLYSVTLTNKIDATNGIYIYFNQRVIDATNGLYAVMPIVENGTNIYVTTNTVNGVKKYSPNLDGIISTVHLPDNLPDWSLLSTNGARAFIAAGSYVTVTTNLADGNRLYTITGTPGTNPAPTGVITWDITGGAGRNGDVRMDRSDVTNVLTGDITNNTTGTSGGVTNAFGRWNATDVVLSGGDILFNAEGVQSTHGFTGNLTGNADTATLANAATWATNLNNSFALLNGTGLYLWPDGLGGWYTTIDTDGMVLGGDLTLTGGNVSAGTYFGSGANLTSLNPTNIIQAGAIVGQVLKWDGSEWTPQNDQGGTPRDIPIAGTNAVVVVTNTSGGNYTYAISVANITTNEVATATDSVYRHRDIPIAGTNVVVIETNSTATVDTYALSIANVTSNQMATATDVDYRRQNIPLPGSNISITSNRVSSTLNTFTISATTGAGVNIDSERFVPAMTASNLVTIPMSVYDRVMARFHFMSVGTSGTGTENALEVTMTATYSSLYGIINGVVNAAPPSDVQIYISDGTLGATGTSGPGEAHGINISWTTNLTSLSFQIYGAEDANYYVHGYYTKVSRP